MTPLPVQPDGLPAELRSLPRWCVWKLVPTLDGRILKVPFQPRPDRPASTTDPATWADFETAFRVYQTGQYAGVGFMFGADYFGFDADHCVQDGIVNPETRQILDQLNTYAELSQSGTGVHAVGKGRKPGPACRKNGYELYGVARYFALTGHRLPDYPATVEDRQVALTKVYIDLFGPLKAAPPPTARNETPKMTAATVLSDAETVALGMRARNGDVFAALWRGDTSRYQGDDSAADLALCNLLAFYTKDASQIDRLMRSSGLRRQKWDSGRGESTYLALTIDKAIGECRESYTAPIELELDDEPDPPAARPDPALARTWPALSDEALIGPFGDLVRTIAPHTEADPVALLGHALVSWGNLVGRTPHVVIGADQHHTNENILIVGDTSTGRKGTAHSEVFAVMADVDRDWAGTRVATGLSSGEGLIYVVRDADPVRDDDGVTDKRLLAVETEFARTLKVCRREGNTLSAIIRQAWDTGTLRTLTKGSPLTATGAHISLIGHISPQELRRELKAVDLANGYINRFLVLFVRRSQLLPDGGRPDPVVRDALVQRFAQVTERVRAIGLVTRTAAARDHWHEIYPRLTRQRDGLVGAIANRAPAHVARLALLYAMAEGRRTVDVAHQTAALAFWEYSEQSVTYIFGQRIGDRLADYLLALVRDAEPTGITYTEIHTALGRHRKADEIHEALQTLLDYGLATAVEEQTKGRPVTRWHVANDAKKATKGPA